METPSNTNETRPTYISLGQLKGHTLTKRPQTVLTLKPDMTYTYSGDAKANVEYHCMVFKFNFPFCSVLRKDRKHPDMSQISRIDGQTFNIDHADLNVLFPNCLTLPPTCLFPMIFTVGWMKTHYVAVQTRLTAFWHGLDGVHVDARVPSLEPKSSQAADIITDDTLFSTGRVLSLPLPLLMSLSLSRLLTYTFGPVT